MVVPVEVGGCGVCVKSVTNKEIEKILYLVTMVIGWCSAPFCFLKMALWGGNLREKAKQLYDAASLILSLSA